MREGGTLRELDEFSEHVRSKAEAVAAEHISQDETDETVWRVVSSRTGKVQRVQFVGEDFLICDCANGSRRGGRAACYHAAAVLMRVAEEEKSNDGGESDE